MVFIVGVRFPLFGGFKLLYSTGRGNRGSKACACLINIINTSLQSIDLSPILFTVYLDGLFELVHYDV